MPLRQLLKKYGNNSNSFLGLYPGFDVFVPDGLEEQAAIAFSENEYAWVGVSEPLCEEKLKEKVLYEFARAAQRSNKKAVLLPVSEHIKNISEVQGYGSIQIGSEPFFNLQKYSLQHSEWPETLHSAKALKNKNAGINTFKLNEVSEDLLNRLNFIRDEWLGNRKSIPLGFVNRVEPWSCPDEKRYFLIEQDGRVNAFLAAVPIYGRKGWYFNDLLRKRLSPPGTAELLMLEAMRLLRDEKYEWVTTGVSPLARLDEKYFKKHSYLFKILNLTFESKNPFYNFKPLYNFKNKFQPSVWEPAFLIFSPDQFNVKVFLGFQKAFVPATFWQNIRFQILKQIEGLKPWERVGRWISKDVIVRRAPKTWREYLTFAPWTVSSIIILLVLFDMLSLKFTIHPRYADYWAWSWTRMKDGYDIDDFISMLGSGLLHWNLFHLFTNLSLIFIFGSTVEIFLGGRLFTAVFFAPFITSNFLTGAILSVVGRWVSHPWLSEALISRDLGASLGAFGLVGAFVQIAKSRIFWILGVLLFVIGLVVAHGDMIHINHLVAFAMGFAITHFVMGK